MLGPVHYIHFLSGSYNHVVLNAIDTGARFSSACTECNSYNNNSSILYSIKTSIWNPDAYIQSSADINVSTRTHRPSLNSCAFPLKICFPSLPISVKGSLILPAAGAPNLSIVLTSFFLSPPHLIHNPIALALTRYFVIGPFVQETRSPLQSGPGDLAKNHTVSSSSEGACTRYDFIFVICMCHLTSFLQ